MRIAPDLGDASIVLVGSFNPRIFRPDWFARTGPVTEAEAGAANVEIIHPEITLLRMDWLRIRVEPGRLIATTEEAPFIRLADLVVRTFREFLGHTPIGMLGINREVHFSVGDEETKDRIGNLLAPKEPWGEWGPQIAGGKYPEKHGGMRGLVMEQRELEDRFRGHIQARVAPSTKVKAGIYMHINDHYEAEAPDDVVGCDEVVSILERQFDVSIRRSEWIIDQIMALK